MTRGRPLAFTPEKHRELVKLREIGWGDTKLAGYFEVSVPTVRKWLRIPLVCAGVAQEKAPSADTERGEPQGLEIKPSPSDSQEGTAGVSA